MLHLQGIYTPKSFNNHESFLLLPGHDEKGCKNGSFLCYHFCKFPKMKITDPDNYNNIFLETSK